MYNVACVNTFSNVAVTFYTFETMQKEAAVFYQCGFTMSALA